ncbi:MAG: PAS domain S-box protein, partial [Candidatus Hydrothermarchaeales archaeon]
MLTQFIQKLKNVSLWHFVWISVVVSEILTAIMSVILRGRITYDYLITGGVVSLIVASIVIYFIKRLRETEESLLESEKKYRYLFENSIEGISISKGDHVISANKALLDIFGYKSLQDFSKVTILDHLAPEYREIAKERMKKREKGEPVPARNEYAIIRKDGKIRDIEVSIAEVVIENEKYVQTTIRDVTERKKAEEALKESEERYRRLFENSLDGMYRSALGGRFIDINPALVKMLGYENKEDLLSVNIPKDIYLSESDRPTKDNRNTVRVNQLRKKDGTLI